MLSDERVTEKKRASKLSTEREASGEGLGNSVNSRGTRGA